MSETSKKIHNLTLSTYVDFWNFSLSTNQEIERSAVYFRELFFYLSMYM